MNQDAAKSKKNRVAQGPKIIREYSERLPSPSTREVTYRELMIAHRFASLPHWDEETAIGFVRFQEGYVARSTLNVRARRLHAFFNDCVERKIIASNPMNLKVIPKSRSLSEPKTITQSECEKLLSKIPRSTFLGCRDRLAISLMLINGLRVSSVVAINWDDVEYRSQSWVLRTTAKGGVVRSTVLRPDVVKLFDQLHRKTFGGPLEP